MPGGADDFYQELECYTHQQRLADDEEEPHTEVSSSWTKSLLQPLAQLHLRFPLHIVPRSCFSTRGALHMKPTKSQGLSILSGTDTVYSWKKEETRKTMVIAEPRDQPEDKLGLVLLLPE